MSTDLEEAAAIRFDSVKADAPFPSMNKWLERATDAYYTYRFTVAFLKLSDEELEVAVHKLEFEAFAEFVEVCQSTVERERAGVEMLDAIIARMLIIGSREVVKAN